MKAHVLIVDDESSIRISLREFLRDANYDVDIAQDADEAMAILATKDFDVVVTDIILPRITGVNLLKSIKKASSQVQVILMTGEPTIETASQAVREGAFDYLAKPIGKEQFLKTVANAARVKILDDERRRLTEDNRRYQEDLEQLVEERTAALHESEEQHYRAQKEESIGRLAGCIAHDLNNLLTPILGYAELLLPDEPNLEDEQWEYANQILQAGLSARDLVQQLLAFGRKQTLEYKPINMNKVIENFEKLLRRTIHEDIEIEIIPSPEIQVVLADIGQIEQVIMNLSINAQDAMVGGGLLTIETALVDLDEEYTSKHRGMGPGKYVMLAVSDTGCGIDDKIREHLFEPFFSTKGEEGLGLGLATVYGIVKQHGGNIWVYSELGIGTIFKIHLPVSKKEYVEVKTSTKTITSLKGSETILVVEDNKQVRNLAHTILKQQGYTVIVAEAGKEALSLLDHHNKPLHLLLTDVVMPGMNGKELFARSKKIYPHLKVLYMSGYTNKIITHRGVLNDNTAFIPKPLTVQSLAGKVRDVLDNKSITHT